MERSPFGGQTGLGAVVGTPWALGLELGVGVILTVRQALDSPGSQSRGPWLCL